MPGQYQEGQRLQGSDGKVYVVQGGVPRQEIARQQSGPPAFIAGTPDPHKAAVEGRAQRADARAAEDQDFQRQKFKFDQEKLKAEREAGVGVDNKARESEAKGASFLIRAVGANKAYEATGVGPRSLVGQTVSEWAPDALNTLPGVVGNSPERQVSDSAQNEFIMATLRQDSGAAIPEEELERHRRTYFPMPGDEKDAIAQKRVARARAIEGLELSAGRLEPEAERRINPGKARFIDAYKRARPSGDAEAAWGRHDAAKRAKGGGAKTGGFKFLGFE